MTPKSKVPEENKKMFKMLFADKWADKLANVNNQHRANITILKLSYTKQIEDLHQTVGDMASSLNEIGKRKLGNEFKRFKP